MEENKVPIFTILVKPKDFRKCEYSINDSNTHTKSYESLTEYLVGLLPEKTLEINRLIGEKRHFIIFLQERKIQELKFDFEAENKFLSDELKHTGINKALREDIANKMKGKDGIDNKLNSISKTTSSFDKFSNMPSTKGKRIEKIANVKFDIDTRRF